MVARRLNKGVLPWDWRGGFGQRTSQLSISAPTCNTFLKYMQAVLV